MDPQSIEAFAQALRQRRVSSVEMVDACLARISADNPRLNAFILVMAEEARREAARRDAELASGLDRGPLHGVPISVKDLFDVQGTVTTAASRVREGLVARADAPAIARLREAGAVVIGKTNLHEFAFGTTNEDSAFGPVRNPLDPTRSPGGSSGGSAASVTAGMALATLGTDTGGSIRIPAAACGLVGLKPTAGELPSEGVVPLSRTLDHVGPLARTVGDAWTVFEALRGITASVRPLTVTAPETMRLAVLRPYFCDRLDDQVRSGFEEALAALRRSGVRIVETTIPASELIAPAYLHIVFGDAAAYHAETLQRVPHLYTPGVRLRLEMARYVLAEDYVRARDARRLLRSQVDRALEGCDALLLPTLPIVAPPLGAAMVRIGNADEPVRAVMLRLTQLFNLTGHPAITLPVRRAGLPVGVQLVGSRHRTETLLEHASRVEAILA